MPTSTTKTSTASASASTTQTVTLKDGLSATVNIISQQANNVLIIPSKAITRQGQNSTVQVVNGTTTETRVVKTGITDGTNTEITSGLTDGEIVTYKLSTSTSSSSSSTTNSNQQQGIPGIGGGGPPQGGF
jgi:multidrug efflux pump subunit AcrA (membrane-fusion protein)